MELPEVWNMNILTLSSSLVSISLKLWEIKKIISCMIKLIITLRNVVICEKIKLNSCG